MSSIEIHLRSNPAAAVRAWADVSRTFMPPEALFPAPMSNLLSILIIGFFVIMPNSAANAAPPLGLGATVAGAGVGTSPGGILATEAGVGNAADYTVGCINTGIDSAANKIIKALQGLTEATKVLDKAKVETILEGLKQMEEAKLAAREEAKARAQASNSCENRDGAAAWGVGKRAAGGFRTDLNARVATLEDGKPKNAQAAADANESRGLEGPMGNAGTSPRRENAGNGGACQKRSQRRCQRPRCS